MEFQFLSILERLLNSPILFCNKINILTVILSRNYHCHFKFTNQYNIINFYDQNNKNVPCFTIERKSYN